MSKRAKVCFYFWLPPAAWMGLIFCLSSIPQTSIPEFEMFDLVIKKGAHMALYAILYFLLLRAFYSSSDRARSSQKIRLSAAFAAILFALSDEFHQTFVPGRGGALSDVGIDSVGILITYLLVRRNYFWMQKLLP